jgi:hypothetical protein
MFWDMAADSSMGMGMGLHQGGSSLHHHGMLSFQSNPDSAPAPAPAPPPAVFLPPPSAPAPQGAPPYKFVTGSPSDWTEYELAIFKDGLVRFSSPNPSFSSSLFYHHATTALLVLMGKLGMLVSPPL